MNGRKKCVCIVDFRLFFMFVVPLEVSFFASRNPRRILFLDYLDLSLR